MANNARGRNRDLRDEEVDLLDERGLLHLLLRREKKVLDTVERLSIDQRALQVAVDDLLEQNEALLEQQSRLHRENAVLRQEIATVRRIGETVPRFTCFMKLPPEIRFHIWELALPRRFVRLRPSRDDDDSEDEGLDEQSKHPPPAGAQVCRESRAIAVRNAGFRAIQYQPIRTLRAVGRLGSTVPVPFMREWTWFDSARDTLLVSAWMIQAERPDILHLTRVARHVVVEDPEEGLGPCIGLLFDPVVYPNLQSVAFAVDVRIPGPLVDIPVPSARHPPPEQPYDIVDFGQGANFPNYCRSYWNTKGPYDDTDKCWVLEEWDDELNEEDSEEPLDWPEFLAKLAKLWDLLRGHLKQPLPSFSRVVMYNHRIRSPKGPAAYLTD